MKGRGDCFTESLKIVSRRDYSVLEVREKLLKKGFDSAHVDDSIRRLRDYGYLDDRALAKSLIGIKFHTAGYGRRKIREYLRRRKIPENIIESEIGESVSRDGSVEKGVELLRKKEERTKRSVIAERRKVLRFLAGRGFDLGECIDIISEYEKKVRDENDGEGSSR